MGSKNLKRASVLGCVAVGTVLALASVAFACTQMVGQITITATGPNASGTRTNYGSGADAHGPVGFAGQFANQSAFCPVGGSGYAEDTQALANGMAPVNLAGTNLTFQLSVAPYNCTTMGTNTKLANDDWYVWWIPFVQWEVASCFDANNSAPVQRTYLGALSVSGGTGTASGNFTLPQVGPANICVTPKSNIGTTWYNDTAPALTINYTPVVI